MTRPHRIREPLAFFHVTARGNNRQNIFETDEDKLDYLHRLIKALAACKIRLHAYCLMTNHLHLLVQDVDGGRLPDAIQRVHGDFAKAWNRRRGRIGHVFNGTYNAEWVDRESYLIVASCYIHNNPVRAGMVKNAGDYRWSSAAYYLGGRSDVPIAKDFIIEISGGVSSYATLLKKSEDDPAGPAGQIVPDDTLPGSRKVRRLDVAGVKSFLDRIESSVERRTERRNLNLRPTGKTMDEILSELSAETEIPKSRITGKGRDRKTSRVRAMLCLRGLREGIAATEIARSIHRSTSAVLQLAKSLESKQPA